MKRGRLGSDLGNYEDAAWSAERYLGPKVPKTSAFEPGEAMFDAPRYIPLEEEALEAAPKIAETTGPVGAALLGGAALAYGAYKGRQKIESIAKRAERALNAKANWVEHKAGESLNEFKMWSEHLLHLRNQQGPGDEVGKLRQKTSSKKRSRTTTHPMGVSVERPAKVTKPSSSKEWRPVTEMGYKIVSVSWHANPEGHGAVPVYNWGKPGDGHGVSGTFHSTTQKPPTRPTWVFHPGHNPWHGTHGSGSHVDRPTKTQQIAWSSGGKVHTFGMHGKKRRDAIKELKPRSRRRRRRRKKN